MDLQTRIEHLRYLNDCLNSTLNWIGKSETPESVDNAIFFLEKVSAWAGDAGQRQALAELAEVLKRIARHESLDDLL